MAAIVEFLVTPKVRNLVGYTSAGIVLMWTHNIIRNKKKKKDYWQKNVVRKKEKTSVDFFF